MKKKTNWKTKKKSFRSFFLFFLSFSLFRWNRGRTNASFFLSLSLSLLVGLSRDGTPFFALFSASLSRKQPQISIERPKGGKPRTIPSFSSSSEEREKAYLAGGRKGTAAACNIHRPTCTVESRETEKTPALASVLCQPLLRPLLPLNKLLLLLSLYRTVYGVDGRSVWSALRSSSPRMDGWTAVSRVE